MEAVKLTLKTPLAIYSLQPTFAHKFTMSCVHFVLGDSLRLQIMNICLVFVLRIHRKKHFSLQRWNNGQSRSQRIVISLPKV